MESYRPALALPGDAARGAILFNKKCSTCHKQAGVGHEVGPNLASLTTRTPESLFTAILDPSAAVETKYLNFVVATTLGRSVIGLLSTETGSSITVVGAEAKSESILRTDIEELRSTGMLLMPDGIEKDFTHQDLADDRIRQVAAEVTHIDAMLRVLTPGPESTHQHFPGADLNGAIVEADFQFGRLLISVQHLQCHHDAYCGESQFCSSHGTRDSIFNVVKTRPRLRRRHGPAKLFGRTDIGGMQCVLRVCRIANAFHFLNVLFRIVFCGMKHPTNDLCVVEEHDANLLTHLPHRHGDIRFWHQLGTRNFDRQFGFHSSIDARFVIVGRCFVEVTHHVGGDVRLMN